MKSFLSRCYCLLLLLLMFSAADTAFAADWAVNYSGMYGELAYVQATAQDAAGNHYLTGYFTGDIFPLGSFTLTNIGRQDAFVAKLDASGAVIWAKNFGGSGAYAYGQSIAVDGSGNVYLGGYFDSANLTTPTLTKLGKIDAFAVKLDADGATVWAKNFGGSGAYAYGQSIAMDESGNVFLGGDFSGAKLTSPVLTLTGSSTAFILKLDSSGGVTWSKSFGGSGSSAYGQSVAVDGSSNVYLGGDFSGNLTTPVVLKVGDNDAFIFKLDSNGAIVWAKNFGGSGAYSYGQSIAVDGNENVYLAGYFFSANLTTPFLTKIGTEDVFALKLDSSGAVTWAKNFGGIGAWAYGQSVTVDENDNIYIGGTFSGANLTTPFVSKVGNQDAFAFKLDSSGAITWAKSFGGSGASAYGQSITVDGNGNVYAGGYLSGANLTTPAVSKIGYYDGFTFKLDSSGAVVWAKSFGAMTPGGSPVIYATTRDGAGNIYLTGSFGGRTLTLGSVTLTGIGYSDVFVAKLDATGTVLWAKNFGGSGAYAYGQGIAVDGSGNVFLGGYFHNANLTTPALTKIGTLDAFALKLNSSGTVLWSQNFGGSGAIVYGQGISVDGSGSVYVGGYFQSANLTTPAVTMIGYQDAVIFKLDASGTITWAKNFGGSGASVSGRSIAVDESGNVYMGGDLSGNLTTPAVTRIGSRDVFAFKLNSGGAVTWAQNFGGSGATVNCMSIAVDGSGNVYLTGNYFYANLTNPILTKIGNEEAFAFKLDSSGAVAWAKSLVDSDSTVIGQSIAVDGSGNVYVGGYFTGVSLTNPALTKIGIRDAFAFKLDSSGNVAWAKNFGGSGAYTYGQSIAVDGSGNIYLGGYFTDANLSSPNLSIIGNQNALIIFNQLSTLTVAAGPHGAISGATSQTVSYGGSASAVSAVPDTGYRFVNWTGTNGFVTTTENPLTVTNVTANMTITANFVVEDRLTVSLSGSGGGSVNSDPGGISCTTGSVSGCSHPFDYGTSVDLSATADWKSTFTGWGLPCSGTGSCTINVAGATGVSASFDPVPRVRIGGATPVDYASLQDAYNQAVSGDTLKIIVYDFTENLNLSRNILINFNGGLANDYASAIGFTTLVGTLTINQGTAILDRFVVQ